MCYRMSKGYLLLTPPPAPPAGLAEGDGLEGAGLAEGDGLEGVGRELFEGLDWG